MARILIVDDDEGIVALLLDLLQSEGHEARGGHGEPAWQAALAWRPDVILLDLMMPGLDGFTFNQRLRAEPRTRAIPVVAMSAAYNLREHGAQLAVAGVLAKPFDIDDLLGWVARLTAPAPPDGTPPIAHDLALLVVDADR